MASLSDQCKAIIGAYPIGRLLTSVFEDYSKFVSKIPSKPSFNEVATSATTDRGAKRLIIKLLGAILALDAAEELPSHHGSSHKSLSEDLAYLAADLHTRFPQQVDIESISILLERVIERPDDEESIWSAVYGLFHDVSVPPTTPLRTKSLSSTSRDSFLHDLHNDWSRGFFGDALIGLRQQMRDCVNDESPYYAKTLVFVQSSGVGKSRLADSFGQICPMISFVLREEGDGYPPSDRQIERFMRQPIPDHVRQAIFNSPSKGKESVSTGYSERRLISIWNHCVVFATLEASFKIFNAWVERQNCAEISFEELARLRHEEMKPIDFSDVTDPRSQKRIDFDNSVAEEAGIIATGLAMDQKWRQLFNREEDSAFRVAIKSSPHMKQLHLLVERLMGNLEKCRDRNPADRHLLVVVFDEVASLFHTAGSSESDAGRYIALNRIFSCLKEFPMWFFLLSTESKVEKILPPDIPIPDIYKHLNSTNRSSARRAFAPDPDQKLRVFPPFVAFPLDIEDQKTMQSRTTRKAELAKPMVKFSEPKHMAMFGRRLWYAYSSVSQMYDVAQLKVIGGRDAFNPMENHHVFAVLSFRLALDACLESTISLPLLRTAVGSYMRIVISMDQRTGFLHTTTPPEPILAHAAMKHLCIRDHNWLASINTLSRELLQQGLIEKGLKGELFARLLLILAHDSLRAAPGLAMMPTFTVKDFLLALYAPDHRDFIQMIDVQILQARMNFTHFALTNANLLPGDVILDLCHDLLRRSAALQLSFNNPAFDQLIPIYFGHDKDPFDRSKCGAIVIQNKNKEFATTPDSIFGEEFDKIGPKGQVAKANNQRPIRQKKKYAFGGVDRPILFLLFDLGTNPGASAPVQVSRSTDSSRPPVWAIHSRGHTEAVFGCLKTMRVESAVETFFAASAIERKGIYHEIAKRNLIFDNLTRSSRYARPNRDGSGYEEDLNGWRQGPDNDGEDIQMKDG